MPQKFESNQSLDEQFLYTVFSGTLGQRYHPDLPLFWQLHPIPGGVRVSVYDSERQ